MKLSCGEENARPRTLEVKLAADTADPELK